MFAVPGWTVPVESLVSAAPHGATSTSSATDNGLLTPKSKSKKRGREENVASSESRITSDDLQKLWSKEFGHSTVRQNPPEIRKNRREQGKNDANSAYGYGRNTIDPQNLNIREGSKKQNEQKSGKKRRKQRGGSPSQNSAVEATQKLQQDLTASLPGHNILAEQHKVMSLDKRSQPLTQKNQQLPPGAPSMLTTLQAKMRNKLTSSRFRHINETLYTSPSSTSLRLFDDSPDLFAVYHEGFAQQVQESWPENPVDGYIHDLKARATAHPGTDTHQSGADCVPLPRRKTGSCTIADLGCGNAPLARALRMESKALNLKFHNFDLHTPNSLVTKADIADLPLRDGEADIAVFCLSLMGTNWVSFIEEAWRVLRGDGKGELWVAEVKSRFGHISRDLMMDDSVGKVRKSSKLKAKPRKSVDLAEDDTQVFTEDGRDTAQDATDVSAFVDVVVRRGFALQPESVNKHNKMFVRMIFHKIGVPSAGPHKGSKWNGHAYEKAASSQSGRKKFINQSGDDGYLSPSEEAKALKPCVYKRR